MRRLGGGHPLFALLTTRGFPSGLLRYSGQALTEGALARCVSCPQACWAMYILAFEPIYNRLVGYHINCHDRRILLSQRRLDP